MQIEDVHDKRTFIAFIGKLRAELADPVRFDEWENATLESFLEAMEAWATDASKPPGNNPWQHAAILLAAGKSYE